MLKIWNGASLIGLIFTLIYLNAGRLAPYAPGYGAQGVDALSNEPLEGVRIHFFGGSEGDDKTFTNPGISKI